MKFPYGISDFKLIITENYFYCDRTDRIALIEDAGRYILFIRPRRFGKSLLLSMLANYYDVAKKDEFDALFGHLKIGKHPTPIRNRFFILKWDFSKVDPMGDAGAIRRALHDHVNSSLKAFIKYYRGLLEEEIEIDPDNAVNSIESLISSVRMTPYPIYLLIDEYDNFANEVMMGVREGRKGIYEALVYEEGPLKTLFKVVKSSTSESIFDRIFITGVSPVVMSDITSGYNIADNIYLKPRFNDLCGFREAEIEPAVKEIIRECSLDEDRGAEAVDQMRTWYNGYAFSVNARGIVYNPTLVLYFLKEFQEECQYPIEMLDDSLSTDDAKLEYVSRIPNGRRLLLGLVEEDHKVVVNKLEKRFGIKRMLKHQGRDNTFLASFLYYFGVLTIGGYTPEGELMLRVPNLVMNSLFVERIGEILLPDPGERIEGRSAAKRLRSKGDMAPLCEFVEQRYFKVFHNPDYKWANELTVKTAFLTLLYNDILYIMDSESEIEKGYTDLTMIIRPDKRHFDILDILIEFKYIKLGDAGLTGEEARKLSVEELQGHPRMVSEMEDARKQLRRYGDALEKKYGNALRLRRYAVASLGFERLWWEEVG